jgi:hypothetical protein
MYAYVTEFNLAVRGEVGDTRLFGEIREVEGTLFAGA